jgi:hypothetical protein
VGRRCANSNIERNEPRAPPAEREEKRRAGCGTSLADADNLRTAGGQILYFNIAAMLKYKI